MENLIKILSLNKIYNLLIILAFFSFIISCSTEKVQYECFKIDLIKDTLEQLEELRIIEFTKSDKQCDKYLYASQAICSRESKCDTVRILILCNDYSLSKGKFVNFRFSDYNFCKKDSIFFAINDKTKNYTNKNYPTYIGELKILLK